MTDNLRFAHHQVRYWMARAKVLCYVPYDDLAQEAVLAMTRAARDFEPGRGLSFLTLAGACIKHALFAAAVRAAAALRHREPQLSALEEGGPDGGPMAAADPDAAEAGGEAAGGEARALAERALALVGGRYAEVLRLRHYEGLTLTEAGRRLGVSRERARQMEKAALATARRRLEAVYCDPDDLEVG